MPVFLIFPRSGFDQSVTTPVLLGVLVSWALTETFGWVFAGLVVPGYLGAVFLLEPAAGVIDVFEAALTFAIARAIGELLPRFGVTSRVFGRERFFLVVLVSILVRLGVEGWLLPRVVPHATWAHSVGLVVVPLAANACWKTGFVRGVVQNGVPTFIVFVLLRWVFVPYTNLSLAGFALATEDLAAGFLSSPKAYMLLVTGAMIAAATNLRYGWDFNGILVPALLGLAVTEPVKFGATFAETLILCLVVAILLRLTPLRRANIEGPRRPVLFFTVDYALRFAWAAAMGKSLPGGDIVAFVGFGYLLPTLLAVKISQKSSVPLVLLPTLKVSLLGFVLGSLIGFAAHLSDRAAPAPPPVARVMPPPPDFPAGAALWVSQLAVDGIPEPDSLVTGDLARIRGTLDAIARENAAAPAGANVTLAKIDDGVLVVRERFDTLIARRGTPSYLFRHPLPERPVVALVPSPLTCPASAALAGQLLHTREVDAVVVAGIDETKRAWIELETTAHAAARWLADGGTLVTIRDAADPRLSKGDRTRVVVPERVRVAARRFPALSVTAAAGEVVFAIDPAALATALAPPRTKVALGSAAEIAAALDPIRPATHPGELENLIGLRRLVLEPLLAPEASAASRALLPFAAAALGYRLTAPVPWAGGGEAVALLPAQRGLPLAVFARTTGVRELLVESPFGSHHAVRDLTVRLAAAARADALILGEVFDGAMRGGGVRAAHAAATSGHAPTVFVVREDPTRDHVTVSAWMDDGKAAALARHTLEGLGVRTADAPPDLAMRDLATRTLLRPTALVAVTAGGSSLEAASLDAVRHAHERLPDLPSRDGTLRDAALALAGAVEWDRPVAPAGIEETVNRAASEGSIVAIRRLAEKLETSAVRAALVRSMEGSFVVAVARTDRSNLVIVSSLTEGGDGRTERRPTLEACTAAPVVPGVCEVVR